MIHNSSPLSRSTQLKYIAYSTDCNLEYKLYFLLATRGRNSYQHTFLSHIRHARSPVTMPLWLVASAPCLDLFLRDSEFDQEMRPASGHSVSSYVLVRQAPLRRGSMAAPWFVSCSDMLLKRGVYLCTASRVARPRSSTSMLEREGSPIHTRFLWDFLRHPMADVLIFLDRQVRDILSQPGQVLVVIEGGVRHPP